MHWIVRGLAVGAVLVVAAAGHAQDASYPNHPVRIIVPFAAGGPPDVISRIVAQKLSERWGQQVYVENHPGAGGNTGTATAARAAPDGYTLYMMSTGFMVNPSLYAKVPYDPIKDFAPVTLVVRNTTILVVKTGAPVGSARELTSLAEKDPGVIPFASTGSGSMTHLALELFQAAAGVKFLHVPYRGAAPALTDLLGGQVQAMFADAPVLMPHITGGALKALGAASAARNSALPDVPTLAEQGFADTVADNWYGLLAPARTPPAILARLHDATVAAIDAPEVRDKLVASGAVPAPTSSAEFGRFLAAELARWGRVVQERHITAD